MRHAGSCHCGGIAFTVEADITEVMECNCSICRRRGHLLFFVPRDKLVLETSETAMVGYRFGKQRITHQFCPTCGVGPLALAANPKTGEPTAAINARCLPDLDLSTLNIKQVNGKDF